jgi:hypothetical protein
VKFEFASVEGVLQLVQQDHVTAEVVELATHLFSRN